MIPLLKAMLTADRKNVLGINRRNIDYVYPTGNRKFFKLADEKLLSKELFLQAGAAVPETLDVIEDFRQAANLKNKIPGWSDSVIKPNRGRGGMGIQVLGEAANGGIFDLHGKLVTYHKIEKHIREIIFGVHSLGMQDKALIEKRIIPHPFFANIYDKGLGDIRLIFYRGNPVMGMVRLPTSHSGGKANLHQGGIGLGLDLDSARTTGATMLGKTIQNHPDTEIPLFGQVVPALTDMLQMGKSICKKIELQYIGFDFTLDELHGPLLLEMNARPGLEIQKANQQGLLEVLSCAPA